ncbi:uncharacterized protein MELLADRAFT_63906 [Melampsora larici-populina 98AG31]|uniref:Uncharacterized protein n=1 Tax=Melampsora larici-populina (strain 98AG31 / pathotype 3-4-7) TaxID=747676 RepID=F4RNY4_MELLP|nr:uncharacterized protein MELLADRAFT_63906 [Melampsora larici-populina 98AG31]EGG05835.1 hypothetical protein MELLADRAFT_63906 [Melampsora larici-populina 98AG31]
MDSAGLKLLQCASVKSRSVASTSLVIDLMQIKPHVINSRSKLAAQQSVLPTDQAVLNSQPATVPAPAAAITTVIPPCATTIKSVIIVAVVSEPTAHSLCPVDDLTSSSTINPILDTPNLQINTQTDVHLPPTKTHDSSSTAPGPVINSNILVVILFPPTFKLTHIDPTASQVAHTSTDIAASAGINPNPNKMNLFISNSNNIVNVNSDSDIDLISTDNVDHAPIAHAVDWRVPNFQPANTVDLLPVVTFDSTHAMTDLPPNSTINQSLDTPNSDVNTSNYADWKSDPIIDIGPIDPIYSINLTPTPTVDVIQVPSGVDLVHPDQLGSSSSELAICLNSLSVLVESTSSVSDIPLVQSTSSQFSNSISSLTDITPTSINKKKKKKKQSTTIKPSPDLPDPETIVASSALKLSVFDSTPFPPDYYFLIEKSPQGILLGKDCSQGVSQQDVICYDLDGEFCFRRENGEAH